MLSPFNITTMERLDSRTQYPSAMEEYLAEYGFHFNKKLFEFATEAMRDRNGNKIKAWDKEKVETFLRNYGVNLKNDMGHDATYVLAMAQADYWGSSITDEQHLALFVRDYIDDVDAAPTKTFDRFYIDCVAKGVPIFWDEML